MNRRFVSIDSDTVLLHVEMLNDRERTTSYLNCIRQTVRQGDVVLDIGTGTGIYAMAAAKAGARHVYAIEACPIARAARALFEANGLSDRITLLRGVSTNLRLPERADVLISEVIGNEPLAEGVIGYTKDALRRLLKKNARLIPGRIKIHGLLVSMPEAEVGKQTFTPATLANWKSWYGFDFLPLAEAVRRPVFDPVFGHFVNPSVMGDWKPLCPPVVFADVDFRKRVDPWITSTQTVTVSSSDRLNAIVVFFELFASDSATSFFSTQPGVVSKNNHWLSPVRLLVRPLSLREGDKLELTYRYRRISGISRCNVRLCR